MDDYSISLGNAVKEARTESKLTQEQIADMLDIDSRTISQIERGLGNPKLETLYPLIRILNVDAKEPLINHRYFITIDKSVRENSLSRAFSGFGFPVIRS